MPDRLRMSIVIIGGLVVLLLAFVLWGVARGGSLQNVAVTFLFGFLVALVIGFVLRI